MLFDEAEVAEEGVVSDKAVEAEKEEDETSDEATPVQE